MAVSEPVHFFSRRNTDMSEASCVTTYLLVPSFCPMEIWRLRQLETPLGRQTDVHLLKL